MARASEGLTEQAKGKERPLLFEVSWEAANKVGGIYTVLRTKAATTVAEYGDRYCLIGPLSASAQIEFEGHQPVSYSMQHALESLRSQGVHVLYGRWLIEGYPKVILFDLGSAWSRLNEWRNDFSNITKIPLPPEDLETNEAIVFGYLVAWFLGTYASTSQGSYIIAHFHEWLVGVGVVLARVRNFDIATIFTTHATLLGRYLCAGDVDFYNTLPYVNADAEAGKRQIYHRFSLERAATHSAHVFTTVSHITGLEAQHLLHRKPDIITPNGINVIKFSALHEFQNLHAVNKDKIHNFVRGHFYGHQDFQLDNTLYFFSAGRYEFRNKGIDMFLESLSRLNRRLKLFHSPITVVAFLIMNAPSRSFTVDALKGQAVVKQMRDTVADIQSEIGKRIFDGQLPDPTELLSNADFVLLKRRIFALKRDTLPSVVTHNMVNDATDPILTSLRRLNLVNQPQDRVKVVFHPEFLSSSNPLFGMDYEDFIRGTHLGVFPSYYEPWGYTPAECTVMGVPSVTTNLAGFGCFMEEKLKDASEHGIYIVDRRFKSPDESIDQLADYMLSFCLKSRRQRINLRNRTERLSDLLDWKTMGIEYRHARRLALHRTFPDVYDLDASDAVPVTARKIPRPASAPPSPRQVAKLAEEDEVEGMGELSLNDEEDDVPLKQIDDAHAGTV